MKKREPEQMHAAKERRKNESPIPPSLPSLQDKKQKFQAIGLTATDRERETAALHCCVHAACLSFGRAEQRAEHVMVVVAQHKRLIK